MEGIKSLRDYVQEKTRRVPEIYHKSVSYMIRSRSVIDDEVYLSEYGCNLQRGYVWSIEQNRALIDSILIGRRIPNLSIISKIDDTYQVIDGKQRLNAYLSYMENKYTIIIYGREYYYDELPNDYRNEIKYFKFICDAYVEISDKDILSDEKILSWFEELNFTGTRLDYDHIDNIKKRKL